ncbi:MAG: hypothetical protein LUI12_11000 [Clostridiales bacterium]|nr:hypothetical protein [Clostridiales bacterium]
MEILVYETRDGKGNDITQEVAIKEFTQTEGCFDCPICGGHFDAGVAVKDAVSDNFTDWGYLNGHICGQCSRLFSLIRYSYIVEDGDISLCNVRQIRDTLTRTHKPPFMICITTSQKKHLFYKSKYNYSSDKFWVNLETESIYTSCDRQKQLFSLVETLYSLGCSKKALSCGEITAELAAEIGMGKAWRIIEKLRYELGHSREIQIPLFCGQKNDKEREDLLCDLDLILTA